MHTLIREHPAQAGFFMGAKWFRRQRAEGRGQRAEGRRQKAEGRGQRAEGRGQRAEGRREPLLHLVFVPSCLGDAIDKVVGALAQKGLPKSEIANLKSKMVYIGCDCPLKWAATRSQTMQLIYFLLRSSWKMVAIAMFTGFLSGGSSAGLIALMGRVVGSDQTASMTSIAWSFGALAGVALTTSIISQVMLIRLSQNAVFQLRLSLSRQILSSELSYLEQLGGPRLLATLTEDIQAISQAVFIIPFLCIDIAIVGGCLVYITWLSWSVLLAVCLFAVLAIGSCQLLLTRGSKLLGLAREEQDRLFQHFRTIAEGTKELKLHYRRRQAFLREDLETSATIFRRHNVNGLTLFAMTSSWGKLLLFFAIGLILFVLPHLSHLIAITPQTRTGYVLTFLYLVMPMDRLVNNLPILGRAGVALSKIQSLGLSLASHSESAVVPDAVSSSWHRLVLKEVTHIYHHNSEDSDFVLGPIDLTLTPGELVFIVGGNGSGKSTLAKLIVGLYVPAAGEIWLDKQPILAENREWYRQHFSTIFADFYLFERLLGLDRPNLDIQARAYLKRLQLEHKVTVEQGWLSTTALSQGQRKRLALLAAYLEDRPIYLFDEWAADQDPVFKEFFYTQLLPGLRDRGKTILAISHDDRYFHLADRIIKLDYGKLEYDKLEYDKKWH